MRQSTLILLGGAALFFFFFMRKPAAAAARPTQTQSSPFWAGLGAGVGASLPSVIKAATDSVNRMFAPNLSSGGVAGASFDPAVPSTWYGYGPQYGARDLASAFVAEAGNAPRGEWGF